MKYSDFVELMEDKGFNVEVGISNVIVRSEVGIVSSISKEKSYSFRTQYISFNDLDDDLRRYITQVAMELSFTELKDREEEEKFKLKQKGISGKYLIWIPELDKFTTGSSPFPNVEGVFTQSEIERMPECYTHPAVWEKIKVEREDK